MKALLFTIAFVCLVSISEVSGKKLHCGKGSIQVECNCYHRTKLKNLLEEEIGSINRKIESTRKLKVQRQVIIHRFIRENGAKIGTMYRCKSRRYQALRDVFKAARQLRVVRALRVKCWRLRAVRWKLMRKCSKIKKYMRILRRKLRSCNIYEKHFMRIYRRAKSYLETKSCKILAFRLKHIIWFQRHRKIRTQRRLRILKHKAYHLQKIAKRLEIKSTTVCRTAVVLQARARQLRKTLYQTRKEYRRAKRCTARMKGAFRKIERRRILMYYVLNFTRRLLRSLYHKRYRKVKLLCSVVEPKNILCTDLNIKLYSDKRFKGAPYY